MPTFLDDLPPTPARPPDSHKGTFGRVLIVAGSRGMSGAACLSGLGALRGGAGLVDVATPASLQPLIASFEPSWLTFPLPEDAHGRLDGSAFSLIADRWESVSAVAMGPGWSVTDNTRSLARLMIEQCPRPMVIDADGLTALVDQADAWRKSPAARVVTPHPGEFGRMRGVDAKVIQADRVEHATEFAREHGVIVVLKGHGTVVTDGERIVINSTGNPGMATGGTGDVLTGLTGALLAQKMAPFDAARLAVYLHGLAGDLAAKELSQPGLIASDLPSFLGPAWLKLQELRGRAGG
ncbi:ATP-dependent (S)-NAD(P)H-hydrate dehydratase [Caulifigura coniformis]|uniref:ADP-dependent (S)-NAD(P)H-hydrate dehydratase n=1 Tax=Caulifigura coniformis TaxID=2527983 RepID=A0A517SKY4_9PLAN|nr:NAD(P)H-hydrate dehydratase [Caulifigura coniformis]QDT56780.1 ATP-dependent (S)-NAD(P)H-hydrate dehydratase [Caulifigura coniformis]